MTGPAAARAVHSLVPWALLLATVLLPPGVSLVGAAALATVVVATRRSGIGAATAALYVTAGLSANLVLYGR